MSSLYAPPPLTAITTTPSPGSAITMPSDSVPPLGHDTAHRAAVTNAATPKPQSDAPQRKSAWKTIKQIFSSKKSKQLSLLTGSCSAAAPGKERGEDVGMAHNCCGVTLFGVLDGVGSWAEEGVDPSLYPRKLNDFLKDEFSSWAQARANSGDKFAHIKEHQPLMDILVRAHARLQKLNLKGSTTVCLAMLFPTGQLHILNLGDSGLRIMRDGRQVFATKAQLVNFNAPRQLGLDSPKQSVYDVVTVQAGDAIITASDGLWDNVWDREWQADISALFNGRTPPPGGELARVAAELCTKAQRYGYDTTYESPFAAHAKASGVQETGGKLDDTTVVLCRVV